MPAISSWSVIVPAQAAREAAQIYANGQSTNSIQALRIVAAAAINGSIAGGSFTTTFSANGYGNNISQQIMLELTQIGYTVSYSGTTVTVSW